MSIKAIQTNYKGIRFRSKLEAQYAILFDEYGVDWEYESQGYILDNGQRYLPDFLLHNVVYKGYYIDLYVEVKGYLNDEDKNKILSFSESAPILLVGNLPWGRSYNEKIQDIKDKYKGTYFYNTCTVDGFDRMCILGIAEDGNCEIFGLDKTLDFNSNINKKATEEAFYEALNYRFDHRN